MYQIHKTKAGETMLIGQMTDSHLQNTIRLYLRRIEDAMALIKNPVLDDPMVAIFHDVVAPERVKAQAEEAIKARVAAIQPYLMEAFMRPDLVAIVSEEMRATFGRSTPMPKIDVFSRLHPPLLEGEANEEDRRIDDGDYEFGPY